MTIRFNLTTGQSIDFGSTPAVFGMSAITILAWLRNDSSPGNTNRIFEVVNPSAVNTNERIVFQLNPTTGSNSFSYFRTSTVNVGGEWRSNANSIPTGTLKHIAVTHDFSSINNDPLFYIDGAAATVNEQNAPSGAWRTTGATNCYVGGRSGIDSIDGDVFGLLVYNRVLSASEIASHYNSRIWIVSRSGLVFAPNFMGVAGSPSDGSTMAAGNTVKDIVSGASGVPSGSPVFKFNNLLSLGGE